MIRLHFAANVS